MSIPFLNLKNIFISLFFYDIISYIILGARIMPNFESIKQFFIDHIDRFVHYKVNTKEQVIQKKYLTENICKEIINNPKVIDFFSIEFLKLVLILSSTNTPSSSILLE